MWIFCKSRRFFIYEFYILVRMSAIILSSVAVSLLVQDKVCTNVYHQSTEFCQHIDSVKLTKPDVRDQILAFTARYATYKNLIEFLPSFLWSLFIGSFLDKYPNSTRIVLLISSFGDLFSLSVSITNAYFYELSPYYLLISSTVIWVTGGMTSFMTTLYRCIAINYSEEIRPIKFALIQFAFVIGLSVGTYFGGHILTLIVNDSSTLQLRTYFRNFFLSFILSLLAFVMVFFLDKDKEQPRKNMSVINVDNEDNVDVIDSNNNNYIDDDDNNLLVDSIENNDDDLEVNLQINNSPGFFKTLLNVDNFRETYECMTKKRPNKARMTIYSLFMIQMLQIGTYFGTEGIFLQFCEKVYHWNAAQYSTFSALSKVIGCVFMTFWTLLLVKRFAVTERKLIVFGLVSAFFRELLIGTFVSPVTYILALPIGSMAGLTSIAIRSKVSKIVPETEVGKVFGLLTTIDSGIPLISSLVYSNLFSLFISTYPGIVYQFSALLYIVAISINAIEDIGTLRFYPL